MLKDKKLWILIIADLSCLGLLILQGLGLITPRARLFHYEAPYMYAGYFLIFLLMTLIRIFFRKGREEEEEEERKKDGADKVPRPRIR